MRHLRGHRGTRGGGGRCHSTKGISIDRHRMQTPSWCEIGFRSANATLRCHFGRRPRAFPGEVSSNQSTYPVGTRPPTGPTGVDPPESTNAGFAAPLTGSCREADPYPTSTGARRDPGELGPPPRLSGRPVHISRRPGTKPHHHEAATGLASRFCSTPRGGHIRPHTPIDTAGVETTARRRDFAHVRSSRCKRGP